MATGRRLARVRIDGALRGESVPLAAMERTVGFSIADGQLFRIMAHHAGAFRIVRRLCMGKTKDFCGRKEGCLLPPLVAQLDEHAGSHLNEGRVLKVRSLGGW